VKALDDRNGLRGYGAEFGYSFRNFHRYGLDEISQATLPYLGKEASTAQWKACMPKIIEHPIPFPLSRPYILTFGPDVGQIASISPDGTVSEQSTGIPSNSRPLALAVRGSEIWFTLAAGSGIGRRAADGTISVLMTKSSQSQPRALIVHPNGDLWFVLTDANALARVDGRNDLTEHPVPTQGASLRSVAAGADGDLWFTENAANKIGRMEPNGSMVGEYDIPTFGSGARAIVAAPDGPLFFSQHDIGRVGELRP
jgi:virginiamycin B lyase